MNLQEKASQMFMRLKKQGEMTLHDIQEGIRIEFGRSKDTETALNFANIAWAKSSIDDNPSSDALR